MAGDYAMAVGVFRLELYECDAASVVERAAEGVCERCGEAAAKRYRKGGERWNCLACFKRLWTSERAERRADRLYAASVAAARREGLEAARRRRAEGDAATPWLNAVEYQPWRHWDTFYDGGLLLRWQSGDWPAGHSAANLGIEARQAALASKLRALAEDAWPEGEH